MRRRWPKAQPLSPPWTSEQYILLAMCQLQIMKSICRPSTENQNSRNAKHWNFLRICKCRKCQYGQCREYWWQWPRRRSIKRISTSFSLSRSPQDDVSVQLVGSFRLHLGQTCLKDVIVQCIHVFSHFQHFISSVQKHCPPIFFEEYISFVYVKKKIILSEIKPFKIYRIVGMTSTLLLLIEEQSKLTG